MSWKDEVVFEYHKNPSKIGRLTARKYGVSWSTMWDFKQLMLRGEVTYEESLTKPKILLFDIETSPILAHVWSLWNNNVSLNQIMEDWCMLSWSAKWLGEPMIYSDCLFNYTTEFADDPNNDLTIVKTLYTMLSQADIIIGHNVKKFDIKKANSRFLQYGLPPLPSLRVIDTLDIAKKSFNLTSNKLDFLATHLGLPNKISHEGHGLWVKCMQGCPDAWNTMLEYNEYDTVLLEQVYLKIRSWYKQHPNIALYFNDHKTRCTTCGSDDVELTGESVYTNLSKFAEVRCNNCGKVSRDASNVLSKEKRASTLRNAI